MKSSRRIPLRTAPDRLLIGWLTPSVIVLGALACAPLVATVPESTTGPSAETVEFEELVEFLTQPLPEVDGQGDAHDPRGETLSRGVEQRPRTLEPRRGPGEVVQSNPLQLMVPFDFDSAELTPTGRRQLDQLARALRDPRVGSERKLALEGHCDERGAERYNLRLSQRRILSAVHYLTGTHQIPEERAIGYAYGKSRPRIPQARTEAEHAANRRVEIRVMVGEPPTANRAIGPAPAPPAPQVDPRHRGRLAVEWGVFRINDGSMQLLPSDGTATLRSRDEYRIYVRPETATYIYIYQVDSKGVGGWLFPREDSLIDNPLPASDLWVPGPDASFRLTVSRDRIEERIYLVASRQPIPEPDRLLKLEPDAVAAIETGKTTYRGQIVRPRPTRPDEGSPPTHGEGATAVPENEGAASIEGTAGADWLWHVIEFGHEPQ